MVHYHTSGMVLHIHSYSSYLSAPQACSRVGGFFFLGDVTEDPDKTKINGAVYVLVKILEILMALAAELEVGSTYESEK